MESNRTRTIKKNFWFNKEENDMLLLKSKRAGMNASDYVRKVVLGYEIKEKPDDRFYMQLKLLKNIAHNMNQVAIKSHKLGFIDEIEYQKNVNILNHFIDDMQIKFIKNERID